jgi:hypothetical protein
MKTAVTMLPAKPRVVRSGQISRKGRSGRIASGCSGLQTKPMAARCGSRLKRMDHRDGEIEGERHREEHEARTRAPPPPRPRIGLDQVEIRELPRGLHEIPSS